MESHRPSINPFKRFHVVNQLTMTQKIKAAVPRSQIVRVLRCCSGFTADFDLDDDVDDDDLSLWQTGFNAGATLAGGDADADLDVDGNDFLVWQWHVGDVANSMGVSAAVPEPVASVFLAAALAILVPRSRHSFESRIHGRAQSASAHSGRASS